VLGLTAAAAGAAAAAGEAEQKAWVRWLYEMVGCLVGRQKIATVQAVALLNNQLGTRGIDMTVQEIQLRQLQVTTCYCRLSTVGQLCTLSTVPGTTAHHAAE
jgi:hypothetical protein